MRSGFTLANQPPMIAGMSGSRCFSAFMASQLSVTMKPRMAVVPTISAPSAS